MSGCDGVASPLSEGLPRRGLDVVDDIGFAFYARDVSATNACLWINARTGEPYSQMHVSNVARLVREKFTFQPTAVSETQREGESGRTL